MALLYFILLRGFSYWNSGEQLLEIVTCDSLTFSDEEARFPDHSLEDTVQQVISQPIKDTKSKHVPVVS